MSSSSSFMLWSVRRGELPMVAFTVEECLPVTRSESKLLYVQGPGPPNSCLSTARGAFANEPWADCDGESTPKEELTAWLDLPTSLE